MLERFEPLKAVGGVAPVLNADLRGQKPMRRLIRFCSPTLAEQIGVYQRFFQRLSAFQNTELSNSLSPPAEPGGYQGNYGAAHAALGMATPGDTTMATKAEVEKAMRGGGAPISR
jgi:hypothetical protein